MVEKVVIYILFVAFCKRKPAKDRTFCVMSYFTLTIFAVFMKRVFGTPQNTQEELPVGSYSSISHSFTKNANVKLFRIFILLGNFWSLVGVNNWVRATQQMNVTAPIPASTKPSVTSVTPVSTLIIKNDYDDIVAIMKPLIVHGA
jgi:hypothetical protein